MGNVNAGGTDVDGACDAGSIGSMRTMRQEGPCKAGDSILGRYTLTGELGQGGMGVVYRCFDEVAGIDVALKALPPELSRNSVEMEDVRENFRLVNGLHHPNIADLHKLEKDPASGDYFLVMECVDGVDLRQWRKSGKDGVRRLAEILPILRQVAAALDFAHGRKIMHRDIKPSNVMIEADGTVKVLDFGLAAQIHTSMSRVSMVKYGTSGTGPYMAPEQWAGDYQDAATDQYALAVLTYQMLAGRCPFESQDISVLRESVLRSTPRPISGLDPAPWKALRTGLDKSRERRHASCGAFVDGMEGRKGDRSRIFGCTPGGPLTIHRRWGRVGAAVGMICILMAALSGWRAWKPHAEESLAVRVAETTAVLVSESERALPVEVIERTVPPQVGVPAQVAIAQPKPEPVAVPRDWGMIGAKLDEVPRDVAREAGLPAAAGLLVVVVGAGGPAETAGLRPRDIVTECNGKTIPSLSSFKETVFNSAGLTLDLTVQNRAGVRAVRVPVASRMDLARGGDTDAMATIGSMYLEGEIVQGDEVRALEWIRKAAESGNSNAMVLLAIMYGQGRGIPKSDASAADWCRKAAQKGHVWAMNKMGTLYQSGLGVARDDAKAAEWYRKGAERGDPEAMNNIGDLYQKGRGVAQSDLQAVAWFHKAADAGFGLALHNLGWSYQNGRGMKRDYSEAARCYNQAAVMGVTIARDALEQLPRASISNLRLEHNLFEKGRKGLRILADITIAGRQSKLAEVNAYFFFANGKPLKDFDGTFHTKDGHVSVGRKLIPPYADSRWNNLQLFFPHDQLHLASGNHDLKLQVRVWDVSVVPPAQMAASEFVSFNFRK